MAYGKGLFVGVGFSNNNQYSPSGEILTSLDGINWQVQFTAPNSISLSGIKYNGGVFMVRAGLGGSSYESIDGTNWQQTSSFMPVGLMEYYSPVYPGSFSTVGSYMGTFLIGGMDGMLLQSGSFWSAALINTPQSTPNGFTFFYTQQVDVPYRIQATTNFLNWETLCSGVGSGQPTNFIYTATANSPARFFRIVTP
jgi:hypothetical protein